MPLPPSARYESTAGSPLGSTEPSSILARTALPCAHWAFHRSNTDVSVCIHEFDDSLYVGIMPIYVGTFHEFDDSFVNTLNAICFPTWMLTVAILLPGLQCSMVAGKRLA